MPKRLRTVPVALRMHSKGIKTSLFIFLKKPEATLGAYFDVREAACSLPGHQNILWTPPEGPDPACSAGLEPVNSQPIGPESTRKLSEPVLLKVAPLSHLAREQQLSIFSLGKHLFKCMLAFFPRCIF